jgi:hypothetical protein
MVGMNKLSNEPLTTIPGPMSMARDFQCFFKYV